MSDRRGPPNALLNTLFNDSGSEGKHEEQGEAIVTLCVSCAVAKPLVSDGSAKAHEMSLAYEKSCLNQLDPPLMLQEFVNHGNVAPPCNIRFCFFPDRFLPNNMSL